MTLSSNFLNFSITNVNVSRSGEVVDDARRVAIELRGVLRELVFRAYPLVFAPLLPFCTRERAQSIDCVIVHRWQWKNRSNERCRIALIWCTCHVLVTFSSSLGSFSGMSGKSTQNHAEEAAHFAAIRVKKRIQDASCIFSNSPFLFMFFILSYIIIYY